MEKIVAETSQKKKPKEAETTPSLWSLNDLRVLDDFPMRVAVKDKNSTWIYANKKLAGDMGLTQDKIPGKTDHDFFPADLAEKSRALENRVFESGTAESSFEMRVISGNEVTVCKITSPIMDDSGEIAGVSVFFLDVIDSGEEKDDHLRRSIERELNEDEAAARIQMLEREGEVNEGIIKALPNIFWIYNIVEGKFVKYNDAFKAITGYCDEDIKRMNPMDYVVEDDVPTAMEAMSRTITEGHVNVELSVISKDGHRIPVEHNAVLLKDTEGSPILIACSATEITERKKVQRLVESQRDLAMVLMQCTGLDETLDTAFKFILEVSNYNGGLVFLLNDDGNSFRPGFQTGLSDKYIDEVQCENAYIPDPSVAREGIFTYMGYKDIKGLGFNAELEEGIKSFAIVPIFCDNDLLGCLFMTSRTFESVPVEMQELIEILIVQVSQAIDCACLNTALRESEERFKALFESTKDIVIIMDRDHRCLYINPTGVNFLGCLRISLKGLDLRTDIKNSPECLGKWIDWAEEVFSSQRPLYVEDERTVHGADVWSELRFSPIRDDSGEVVAVSLICRDVSERRIAQRALGQYQSNLEEIVEERTTQLQDTLDELKRSNAELEQFAYVASHDLKEPLRMVSSYMQLIAKRYHGKLDPDADDFIYYAVDGASRMQTLIDDLLAYSRVGTRGGTFERVEAELILDRVKANLKGQIGETEAEITSDELPTVVGDISQLVQLFQNLLGNAMKFKGDEKPVIHISSARKGDFWEFSVKDNGIGFESKKSELIFQLFQRLHGMAKYKGTGIGLSICKRIVLRHGGEIWADSSPGEGSTFYFTLPVRGGVKS